MYILIYLLGCLVASIAFYLNERYEYRTKSSYKFTLSDLFAGLAVICTSWFGGLAILFYIAPKIVLFKKKED